MVYVYAQSEKRIRKERAMRKRRLKRLIKRLHELRSQKRLSRDNLLMKLGAAKKEAGRAFKLMDIVLPSADQPINAQTFHWRINRMKYRRAYRREGRYLFRSNLPPDNPAKLWQYYIQLTEVEEAFRNLKGDLAIRPIHHQLESRIEAHIFVSFLAYCLHVTLKQRCKQHATGLTPRSVLEQLKAMQMIDVQIPYRGRPVAQDVPLHSTRQGPTTAVGPTAACSPSTASTQNHQPPTQQLLW